MHAEKIIIAGIEGDYHEFGIMMAALLCKHHGLKFYYLGPGLPAKSLIDTFQSLKASTIILGATSAIDNVKDQGFIDNYLSTITNQLGPNQKLIFGGNASYNRRLFTNIENFTHFTDLTGLDAYLAKV
ncbi:MAG: hypothetical protein H6622_05520 [Halobacteriovoraceae bacterium]|nr:hypothetical protein [Halobacteriovoraceae bacterium]